MKNTFYFIILFFSTVLFSYAQTKFECQIELSEPSDFKKAIIEIDTGFGYQKTQGKLNSTILTVSGETMSPYVKIRFNK